MCGPENTCKHLCDMKYFLHQLCMVTFSFSFICLACPERISLVFDSSTIFSFPFTLQLWSFKMIYCCEGIRCNSLKIKLHYCYELTAILHCCPLLISSWFGEDGAFWCMSSCPYANLGSSMKATFMGLLDPKGFSQVLSSDFLVLDFLCYSTREPSPFTIMEPFTHHPAWSKEDQTQGDQRQNYRK